MTLNAGIYNALLQPARSAFEYQADFEKQNRDREQAGQARQLNALALQQRQGQISDENMARSDAIGVRNVLAGGGGAAELRKLGSAGALEQASAIERRAAEAQRAQTGSDAQKQEAMHQRLKVYREALGGGMVTDPQAAAQWLRAQYEDPATGEHMLRLAGPFEEAVKRIPTDPAGFARWQQQNVMGMDKFIASTAPKPQQVRAGDRVAIVDMNPNSPTYGTEQQSIDVNATPGQTMLHERAVAKGQGRGAAPVGRSSGGASPGGKAPSGYRWAAGGALEPIPGGPADKGPAAGAPGAAPKLGAEVNRQITGILSLNKDLDALKAELRNFNPRSLDQLDPVKRARIESLSKQALMNAKEAAALGALTGPDMAVIEGILSTPTSARGVLIGGAGSLAQIDQVVAGNRRRFDALREQYGDAAVPQAYRGPAAAAPSGSSQPAAKPATKTPTVSNW